LDDVNQMISSGKQGVDFKDVLTKVTDRVEILTNMDPGTVSGVTTGFNNIDVFTGGWQKQDLIIVAARPGMGKTSLILKNLLEIARSGDPVGIFSLEMSAEQLATRLVAIDSNLHLNQLLKIGLEKQSYWNEYNQTLGRLAEMNILIDDVPGLTVQQLRVKARQWKRKHGLKCLFVDYIQLMSGDAKSGNREQEISVISRTLKMIAKELDIPVVALSQLSRSVETRGGDKRPKLSDLRESGAIEQDADAVVFIYRPEYYGFDVEPDFADAGANAELIFATNRHGSIEVKGIHWIGDKTKFCDPSEAKPF
jgi:replicative DNA helicase